jgi:hypothetical protein
MDVDELEDLAELSRLCFLMDGIQGSPAVPCLLRYRRSEALELETPLAPAELGFRPSWVDNTTETPASCMLQSYEGNVALHGLRPVRRREGHAPFGRLDLAARYAVLGANELVPSGSPQRVRSQISGLHEWLQWGDVEQVVETNDEGRVQRVSIELSVRAPEKIRYGDVEFSWEYSWRVYDEIDERQVKRIPQRTFFITSREPGLAHDDHLDFHRSLRDLLMLCYWSRLDFLTHEQLHEGDPDVALAGNSLGAEWRPLLSVLTLADSGKTASQVARFPAFTFRDLHVDGFLRWLEIRKHYSRGYDPIISFLARQGSSPQEALLSLCVGIEALAYRRVVDAGSSESAANRLTFRERLLVLASLDTEIFGLVVGGDIDGWATVLADAYNGIKHANRELPDPRQSGILALTAGRLAERHLLHELGLQELAPALLERNVRWMRTRDAVLNLAGWLR